MWKKFAALAINIVVELEISNFKLEIFILFTFDKQKFYLAELCQHKFSADIFVSGDTRYMHLRNVNLIFIFALWAFWTDNFDQLVVFDRENVIGDEIIFRSFS